MRKILAIILCTILLVCSFTISAFAEEESVAPVEQSEVETSISPATEELVTEGEISADTAMAETSSEKIVEYIKGHFEELSVIVSLILYAFYQARKHILLNKSIGTLNNNAVEVSRNSDRSIQNALTDMKGMTDLVTGYKEELANLLAEVRESAEEKKRLEETLDKTMTYLKAAELANVELGNELAELLVLANIPNSKKEELYSRHRAAVDEIIKAEHTEVISNDHGTEE